MTTLSKPDVTKFDNDDDSIKDARPEMETAFTSLNTIIDDYNAGTLPSSGSISGATYETETFTTVGPHVVAVTDGVVNEYIANGSGGTVPVIEIDVQNFTGQGFVVMKNIGSANATFKLNRGATNFVIETFITNGEAIFQAFQFAGAQNIKVGIFIPDNSVNSGVPICF